MYNNVLCTTVLPINWPDIKGAGLLKATIKSPDCIHFHGEVTNYCEHYSNQWNLVFPFCLIYYSRINSRPPQSNRTTIFWTQKFLYCVTLCPFNIRISLRTIFTFKTSEIIIVPLGGCNCKSFYNFCLVCITILINISTFVCASLFHYVECIQNEQIGLY